MEGIWNGYGYFGCFLRIDLSTGKIKKERKSEDFYRKFIGGAGFIGHTLLTELPDRIDPLSKDNKLIFAQGPLSGIPLAGASRQTIGAISPLTNGICKSEVGKDMS